MRSKASSPPEKGVLENKILASTGLPPVGVDEVGRGCIAGPVVTCAIVLDYPAVYELDLKTQSLIRDSKKLSRLQRAKILPVLKEVCLGFGVGRASEREIEKYGIVPATFLAMNRSLAKITCEHSTLLVDGAQPLPDYTKPQQAIISGDSLCFSIAAASIIAKEYRDNLMMQAAKKYPDYGFENHVGYGTKAHIEAIHTSGVTPCHRRNFAPISKMKNLPDLTRR